MGAPALELLFRRYAETQDESAARELVARTRPRLLAIARSIGNTADAEDSVQTAYLSLLHKRADFDAPVLAWLVTATVRIAYRAKAKRQRLTELAAALVRPPAPETPAALAVAADEKRVLRQRVADLPASLRDAAVLHYFHGLSTEETARLLDLSRDAVKKRLQRARTTLRSRWGPRLASLVFAFPWWCADTVAAAAGLAGGLVMKKAAVVVAVLITLAATTVGFVWQQWGGGEQEGPPRSSLAARSVPEPAVEKKAADSEPADPGVEDDYSGVVVTPDGQPVESANVRIGGYFWKNVTRRTPMLMPVTHEGALTDAAGRFTLAHMRDNVAAVEYHAHAEGFAWTSVNSKLDQKARIVLRYGGTLQVSVRGEDGSAIGSARVFVRRRARKVFEGFLYGIGSDARFDLIPGEYEVRCNATGFAPSGKTVVKIAHDRTRRLVVTLNRGLAYRIHVVDPEGRGVEGAAVEIRGPESSGGQAKTDRSGRCRIAGIKAGPDVASAHFGVKAAGYAPYYNLIRVPQSEGEEYVRLELRRGARVVFRFRGIDGAPLKKQEVYVFYTPREPPSMGHQLRQRTDDKGEIVFPALEQGSALVRVMELEKHTRTIKLTGKPQQVLIDLSPGEHELAGSIRAPDGSPLKSGSVGFVPVAHAKKGPGTATRVPIGVDGSFRLAGLEAGDGSLWVWAPGFEAQHAPVRVPSESVEMRLREALGVAGVVVTRAGAPVAGVPVRLERNLGGWTELGTVTTDAEGRFALRGVVQSEAKLQVRVKNDTWIESHGLGYAVTPGDMSLRLTVKPESEGWGLKIPIEAVDDSGRPLHGHMEIKHSRDGRRGRWHLAAKATKTPGRFMLVYYDVPGTWDFRFSLRGYLPVVKTGVVVADTAKQPVLRVVFDRGATLTVVARDADGTPVAKTSLYCEGAVVRTDARGRVQFSGFPPGVRRIVIYKHGDYFVHSGGVDAEFPGRIEVVMVRRASVVGRAEGKGPFHWKLVDADGIVRDERTTDANRTRLFTTVGGPHRLVVRHGEESLEYEVTAKLGESVSVGPK